MKAYIMLALILVLTLNSFGQSIFKGLKYGMNKSEAVTEFRQNKKEYITIDVGNGFLYRIYKQNFVYEDNKLIGILLTPKGAAFGQLYDYAKNYLTYSRSFFEKLGYETLIENKWWDAPLNYSNSGSKWGLVLNKKDKSTIVQMYPISFQISGSSRFLVKLMIWNYDAWIKLYNKENKKQTAKFKDSGF